MRSTQSTAVGRRLLRAAACALLAVIVAACGSTGPSESGKVTITFWDNNGGVRTAIWKELIADFEKANPDIDVKYVGIPIASVQQKYDTAIEGGGPRTSAASAPRYLANLVGQHALEPLDDRLAKSPLNGKLERGHARAARRPPRTAKLYSIPNSANLDVLWYRTDLFKARAADHLGRVLRRGRQADQGPRPVRLHHPRRRRIDRPGAGRDVRPVGHDLVLGRVGKSTVNDPKNVEALEKYAALYKKITPAADVNNDFTKMVAQWDTGKIGMLNHNLGSYQDHVKALGADKFRRGRPARSAPSGKRRPGVQPGRRARLFKNSKNKEAAWKFIEFLVSHEANS